MAPVSTPRSPMSDIVPGLPRQFSFWECLGFGLSGLLLWQGGVGSLHHALGEASLWVWLPCVVVAIVLNFQLKRLVAAFPEVAGGSGSYLTRLLGRWPWLGRYAASGYYLGWVSVIPINAIVLGDLADIHLAAAGLPLVGVGFDVIFTLLPFVLALSGSRALAVVSLFFTLPTILLLLGFVVGGLVWLGLAPQSPGLLPTALPSLSGLDWARWYFVAVYAVYGTEGAAAFAADARRPVYVRRCLTITAYLLPVVYLGGSWVVERLSTDPAAADNAFLNLLAAARPFWGSAASLAITLMLAFSSLLSSASTVSLCARVLYQASCDGQAAPVFAAVSRRGAMTPALLATLVLCLLCLVWGDVVGLIVVTGTGYLLSMLSLNLGLWLHRRQGYVRWPWWALACFIVESGVLLVGGVGWNWGQFLLGLGLPVALLAVDGVLTRWRIQGLSLAWWQQRMESEWIRQRPRSSKLLVLQVNLLLSVACGATLIGWFVHAWVQQSLSFKGTELLAIAVLTVGCGAIAIAASTSLPQVAALGEAESRLREQAQVLEQSLHDLKAAQSQLIQSEKMSGLGQLVAGVAHEINNPIGFVYGNINLVREEVQSLLDLIAHYEKHYPNPPPELQAHIQEIDLEFLKNDLPEAFHSMNIGAERIKTIVLSLRNFSRMDEAEFKTVNLHEGIDNTLLILSHRLKGSVGRPKIQLIKQYGQLPPVDCYAGQLNQVFMNLLANALDALEARDEKRSLEEILAEPSQITITTRLLENDWVEVAIQDNGPGIPEAVRDRVFDPFYTTKPVGKGTGLGLSIVYQIVTEKHGGRITCASAPGQGTCFTLSIPCYRPTELLG